MKWNHLALGALIISQMGTSSAADFGNKPKVVNRLKGNLHTYLQVKPYIGLSAETRFTTSKNDWRPLFPQTFHAWGIFLGNRFNKYVGLEISHFSHLTIPQKSSNATTFFGHSSTAVAEFSTKIKRRGFNLDVNLYKQWDPKFNFTVIAGIGVDKSELLIMSKDNNTLANALTNVSGQSNFYYRVGLGGEYIDGHWGARARVMLEFTDNVRANIDSLAANFPTATRKTFNKTVLAGMGVFFQF